MCFGEHTTARATGEVHCRLHREDELSTALLDGEHSDLKPSSPRSAYARPLSFSIVKGPSVVAVAEHQQRCRGL